MKRRNFLRNSSILTLGATLLTPFTSWNKEQDKSTPPKGKYRNVIFMVSDGMSSGTLTMANLLHRKLHRRDCTWIDAYKRGIAHKALMDTSSASSMVTDSSAGSSAWGGGRKVNNGSLNYNESDKTFNTPILKKMKDAGKSIGCVTTVPVTHATPAGFCVATPSRDDQSLIAELYLELEPDVMLGGGSKYFDASKRKDKKDMYKAFEKKHYFVAKTKKQLQQFSSQGNRKLLGTFDEDALPYSLDHQHDDLLKERIPTLAEMTAAALETLSKNPNGFMLQVEGGKVDWAAHANDIGALLYDQLAFDAAISVVKEFVKSHPDTLVIITTDHGNANPGLFYGKEADGNFEKILQFRHTTDWVLNGITRQFSPADVISRFREAFGFEITTEEASHILGYYEHLSETGVYNYRKLPYKYSGEVLAKYTSCKFADMDHSGDHVELTVIGQDLPRFPSFIQNDEVHHQILKLTGL